jgi:MtN3 and saliva related transmembrane protein
MTDPWKDFDLQPLLTNALGFGAAVCSMTSFLPQVIKIARERDASSVSLRMYVVTVTGFALWIAYGVTLKSWPLVSANAVCLGLAALILIMKLRFSGSSPVTARGAGAR